MEVKTTKDSVSAAPESTQANSERNQWTKTVQKLEIIARSVRELMRGNKMRANPGMK
jgi:hypothetical protein